MKHLVVLVMLLLAVSGCDSATPATISAVPDRPSDTESSAKLEEVERPVVTDIGKWPLFEDIDAGRPGWVVFYNVGLKSYTVRVPVKELTDEIVRDYVLKDWERHQQLEREKLEIEKRFKGKKY